VLEKLAREMLAADPKLRRSSRPELPPTVTSPPTRGRACTSSTSDRRIAINGRTSTRSRGDSAAGGEDGTNVIALGFRAGVCPIRDRRAPRLIRTPDASRGAERERRAVLAGGSDVCRDGRVAWPPVSIVIRFGRGTDRRPTGRPAAADRVIVKCLSPSISS